MKNIYEINGCKIPEDKTQLRLQKHNRQFKIYSIICDIIFVVSLILSIIMPVLSYIRHGQMTINGIIAGTITGIIPMFFCIGLRQFISKKDEELKDEIYRTDARINNIL